MRELVKRALDADSNEVDMRCARKVVIAVFADGLHRRSLDPEPTRRFSSTKDDERPKVAFGVRAGARRDPRRPPGRCGTW